MVQPSWPTSSTRRSHHEAVLGNRPFGDEAAPRRMPLQAHSKGLGRGGQAIDGHVKLLPYVVHSHGNPLGCAGTRNLPQNAVAHRHATSPEDNVNLPGMSQEKNTSVTDNQRAAIARGVGLVRNESGRVRPAPWHQAQDPARVDPALGSNNSGRCACPRHRPTNPPRPSGATRCPGRQCGVPAGGIPGRAPTHRGNTSSARCRAGTPTGGPHRHGADHNHAEPRRRRLPMVSARHPTRAVCSVHGTASPGPLCRTLQL